MPRRTHRTGEVLSRAARIEKLERRMLLSLSPAGTEFRANTFTASDQTTPAIAADADGDFVVVWDSFAQDGSGRGIYAQRYNAAGTALGSEFRVNTFTTGDQRFPAVAMDADGDFVIAWGSDAQDGSNFSIFAQRFNSVGVKQGGEFRVNTFTTGFQDLPAVAMDASGDFVVTWQGNGSGDTYGVYGQRYNAAGVAQGDQFRVNTYTTNSQRNARVARDAAGDFVVAWSGEGSGDTSGIFAQRYNALGVAQGGEFLVNTATTGTQSAPSVAMDAGGDFVVAWTGAYDIFAQRFNAAGVAQGTEFRVNTIASGFQTGAAAAMDADGDFLIAWSDAPSFVTPGEAMARSFDAAGVGQPDFRANTFTTSIQDIPRVAMDSDGNAIIAWRSFDQDGSGEGVYAQRYDESNPDTAPPVVGGVFVGGNEVIPDQQIESFISSLALSFSEEMSLAGGTSGANSATNPANYRLLRNGVDVSSQIASASFAFNSATRKFQVALTFTSALMSADYVVKARDTLRDLAGNTLDGDGDGVAGGDFARTFSVKSVAQFGPEFRVNTFTPGAQKAPAAAMDAVGNFVVVWDGLGDDDAGVFAQRFDVVGQARGSEFRVNTFTPGDQSAPAVAMSDAGDFVVAWTSSGQDGSGQGVYAQRYNSAGIRLGAEFRVNTTTAGEQLSPSVAMDAAGDFVIVWSGNGPGDGTGIFARRYDAAGVAQGAEFIVNTRTIDPQQSPAVAMDADGNFVVAWEDWLNFPVGDLIVKARRFNAAGTGESEFTVATSTSGQFEPSVAMDSDGDFVVAWRREERDIFARRFDAAGVGGEAFPANTFNPFALFHPAVAMDSDGNFVITWRDVGPLFTPGRDGSGYGVFAQRFSAAGAPQGGEFQVNTFTMLNQDTPAVAMSQDGNFVVAWDSAVQDPDGSQGVYAQLYVSSIPLPIVEDSSFHFDTAPHRLQFRFSANVSASLGTDDIVLENLTTMQTIPSSDLSLSYDQATNTATFSYAGNASGIAGVLPDGNYRATLLAASVTFGGTPLAANHVFNFFFQNGDANHDGRVNLSDFNILAAFFGQTNRNFSNGDFNYDTLVNLADFNILASRFGQVLAPQPFGSNSIRDTRSGEELRKLLEELTGRDMYFSGIC